ncbi:MULTISPECIES: carbohydrate ABC transporter permease [Brevibacillus]|uniref:carbohydrate ABC transporter permease n=1 Tax=Brevibacillus TaxID=55080 RepID=UPI000D0F90E4|nr:MULTISPECIES: carbohydrate ABC transporter permease [Brevibacillus]PSJ69538.1 carbohydrate ABC transporter permease [Brevibacillus brevis]RED23066.1 carbohydrate ABC transporter membrane protein 2 (CUT1 family) [Brevibacillus brevis]TQK45757.1 carbohydrate ABC transporter membrane protein 2 (CUT1 family) [Brevibacillus sp. AG162]VEF87448.1 Inner membrane ABC transporter permease protein ycjP [Brevibacillus brevis]GEC89673.1 sugar ABC transporter permease [Brevibacillus brevis]
MQKRFPLNKIIGYLFVIASALIMLVPFLTTVFNSLKTYKQYMQFPPEWLPNPAQWSNYTTVWEQANFSSYTINSLIVAILSVIGALLSSSMIAFAFARLRFPFRDTLFMIVLGTMMIPGIVTIVPQFIIFKNLGLLDTLAPLWILEWLGQPFAIFLMRQAFLNIPKDYEEAAKLDGCNPFQIYWRVFLPMCKPSLATLAVFTFMGKWNEILAPVIYLISDENFTLPIGILSLSGQYKTEDQLLVAGALISLIPILIVFLFAEKYFVEGSKTSGLK